MPRCEPLSWVIPRQNLRSKATRRGNSGRRNEKTVVIQPIGTGTVIDKRLHYQSDRTVTKHTALLRSNSTAFPYIKVLSVFFYSCLLAKVLTLHGYFFSCSGFTMKLTWAGLWALAGTALCCSHNDEESVPQEVREELLKKWNQEVRIQSVSVGFHRLTSKFSGLFPDMPALRT